MGVSWSLTFILVHPVVLALVLSLLGPVHILTKVIVRKFVADNGSDLLLDFLGHLRGSTSDGQVVVVNEAINFIALVCNVVVVVVSGKHIEWTLFCGASHGGLAGRALEKTI